MDILALFQKKTDALEIRDALRKYISRQYGENIVKDYETVLGAVQQLRNEVRNLEDRKESSRDVLLKYFVHLRNIEAHFPFNDGTDKIKLSFNWYDCFTKRKASQSNINYEQANILFNAAAISSQLGAAENRQSAESTKIAAKHFQNAAGLFDFIKDSISPKIVEKSSIDLGNECLETLSTLMLGYAQICSYEMALKTNTSLPILSKLAFEVSVLFKLVNQRMSSTTLAGEFDKNWTNFVKFASYFFESKAQFHSAQDNHAKDKIGEEISRLQKCQDLLKESQAFSKGMPANIQSAINDYKEALEKAMREAIRDNDKVFHDRVPTFDTLPPLTGHRLAKPSPADPLFVATQIGDSFVNLIPVRVLEAKNNYMSKFNQRVQLASRTAREHRERTKAALAQMGLPGSIFAAEKKEGIPDEIFTKVQKSQNQGGLARLQELLQLVAEMSAETRVLCENVEKSLQEEEQDDNLCREQFGARWPRLPSTQLTVNLKKQLIEFKSKVQIASQSDSLIQTKINDKRSILEKLELSKSELDLLMPHLDIAPNSEFGQSHTELKTLLKKLDEMHQQEENIENAIKTQQETEDIQTVLLRSQDNLDAAIENSLQKYDPKLSELSSFSAQEDEVLARIQFVNNAFVVSKNKSQVLTQRETVLQNLVAGVNKYEEILANLKEGMQFYSNMQELIRKLKQRIDDFVFARKTEKQDILSNIQEQSTSVQYNNPVSGMPSYSPSHQPQSQQPQQPRPQQTPPPVQYNYNNQPQPGQPNYGQPQYHQPMPQYQQPGAPVYGQPQYQQPGAPVYGQPQYQQPQPGQPGYNPNQPRPQQPGAPVYGQPQYQSPYQNQRK